MSLVEGHSRCSRPELIDRSTKFPTWWVLQVPAVRETLFAPKRIGVLRGQRGTSRNSTQGRIPIS